MFKIEPKDISTENYTRTVNEMTGLLKEIKTVKDMTNLRHALIGRSGVCAEYRSDLTVSCVDCGCPLGACLPGSLDKSLNHYNPDDYPLDTLQATYEATGNPASLIWMHYLTGDREKLLKAAKEMLAVIKTFEPYVY